MSHKKINIDVDKILKELVKSSNFNYQRAKALRIKYRETYDKSKEIKNMRKKLGTQSFGQYLAKQLKIDKK